MNKGCFRLIFSRVRNMTVAVAEFATARGSAKSNRPSVTRRASVRDTHVPVLRAVVFAAMLAMGAASTLAWSQIVAAPGSGAQVIQTQNGLNQVNIARPSGSGVSLNTYSQFDVPGKGAILNNSPTIVQTQQAGYINGNANLTPGQEARVIVNQVMSNSPSQLRGYLEVAGPRAELVIANRPVPVDTGPERARRCDAARIDRRIPLGGQHAAVRQRTVGCCGDIALRLPRRSPTTGPFHFAPAPSSRPR